MPPFTVTEPGVLKLPNNINPSKAGGPDGFSAKVPNVIQQTIVLYR